MTRLVLLIATVSSLASAQINRSTADYLQQGDHNTITDAGGDDTYVGCPLLSISGYKAGMSIHLIPSTANTGAATINVCGLGVKDIKTAAGADPDDSTIIAGQPNVLLYDGTRFKILASASGGGGGGSIATTSSTLKGDNAGGAVAVTGTGTDCVLVNGSSATCGAVTAANISAVSAAGADGCITPAVDGSAIEYPFDVTCLESLARTPTGYWNFSGGQVRFPETTVASLPSAAANTGKIFIVTDADDASDCTSGGGSLDALCRSDGSAYVSLSGTPPSSPLTGHRAYTIHPFGWTSTAVTTAGANRIRGWYFTVENDMTTTKLSAFIGTAGGASTEWAYGVYSVSAGVGTRLCQSGALSAVSGNTDFDVDCALTIAKGTYLIAWGGENTTMRFGGLSLGGTTGGFIFADSSGPFGAIDLPVGDAFSDTTGLPATLDVAGATRLGDVSVFGAILW